MRRMDSIEHESGDLVDDVAPRRAAAQQPELLDPASLQAAASSCTQPSRPPGMNGFKKQRQVS